MEVVRCKRCKHRGTAICPFQQLMEDDFFCAYGARPTWSKRQIELLEQMSGVDKNQITFHTTWDEDVPMLVSWEGTLAAISRPHLFSHDLHTTQMGLLNTSLFEQHFRVYIKDKTGKYEVKIGHDNRRTDRRITPNSNIFKMWLEDAFAPKPVYVPKNPRGPRPLIRPEVNPFANRGRMATEQDEAEAFFDEDEDIFSLPDKELRRKLFGEDAEEGTEDGAF